MINLLYNIETFNPKEATDDLWNLYFDYYESYRLVEYPDEPLPSRDLEKEEMINHNKYYDVYRWIVFANEKKERIIGTGLLWHENSQSPGYEEVKDFTMFFITVDSNYRRKGLGSKLLEILTLKTIELNKKIMRLQTTNVSGMEFCKKIKGVVVAERAQNRLYIDEINWKMMDSWREEGKKKAFGVTLETFEEVPEKDLEEYCKLYTDVFNIAPAEDIPGKFICTPERRRIDEQDVKDKKYSWITIVSREQTGELSGLTEIYYHHSNPEEVEQELTGVKTGKQKRGIGKWLKAEMLFLIKDNFPDAKYISTGNNDRNAPMLSINNRMGFKRYKTELIFEIEINVLKEVFGI